MFRYIVFAASANRARYRDMLGSIGLPKAQIASIEALADFYRTNGLSR